MKSRNGDRRNITTACRAAPRCDTCLQAVFFRCASFAVPRARASAAVFLVQGKREEAVKVFLRGRPNRKVIGTGLGLGIETAVKAKGKLIEERVVVKEKGREGTNPVFGQASLRKRMITTYLCQTSLESFR